MMETEDRFWRKVEKTDGCWLWRGMLSHNGYGRFVISFEPRPSRRQTRIAAHRFALQLTGVVIPEGMEVDHLCKTRNCVRADHLEVVTGNENIRRSNSIAGVNSRKTHCIRQHPLDGGNLYVTPNGRRQCRTCRGLPQKQ